MPPSEVSAILWAWKTLETWLLYGTCGIKHIMLEFHTSATPWYFMNCKIKD